MASSARGSKRRRGRGEGGIYKDARGLWTATIELPPDPATGARRRKVIRRTNKGDLMAERDELLRQLDAKGNLPTSSPTLAQWLDTWLERKAKDLKPSSSIDYRSKIDLYVVPVIGRFRLDKLTPDHIRRVHQAIAARGLSTTTALTTHRILSKALKDALREGKVKQNVAELIDAPRRAVPNRRALTVDQALTLLRHVSPDLEVGAPIAVALLTGMRQGERLGITREMVDLDAGTITVAWQLQRLTWQHGCGERKDDKTWPCGKSRGASCPQRRIEIPDGHEARQVSGGLWLLRPKTRAGWRVVPMAGPLTEIMRRVIAAQPDLQPDDLVFNRAGRPIDSRVDWDAWATALADAGLPHVEVHAARHTCATLLRALGVPEQTRMEIMGHSSAVAQQMYAHGDLETARQALDQLAGVLQLGPAS